MRSSRFASQPNPARDYADAVARVERLRARDTADVNPDCRTLLLTRGNRAKRAVVFFHGASNCPAQFRQLGEELHAAGCNVFVPRLPHHGMADRLTGAMKRLTADELVRTADEAVDIARGLGERVIVAGLSAGGIMTGWAAAERGDVDRAVLINPAFAPRGVSIGTVRVVAPVVATLPNIFRWWNPEQKAASGPPHAYPRYSTRALAHMFVLSAWVFAASERPPRAREVVVVTTATDPMLDNPIAEELARRWAAQGGNAEHFCFRTLPVIHDIIDPAQHNACIADVYPTLAALLLGEPVPEETEPRGA